ncbi:MAG: hypothetical protein PF448_13005 [Bacteroidales bacterium]|jgi:hypothetical protein|nr:hypothetical protein [Bacteroidales bacterium]
MAKETIELRFIPYFRTPVAEIKALGFKELQRSPNRIRTSETDHLRHFILKDFSTDS